MIRVWTIESGKAVTVACPASLSSALEIYRAGAAVAVSVGAKITHTRSGLSASDERRVRDAIDCGYAENSAGGRVRRVAAQNAVCAPRCANHGCLRPPDERRRDLLCSTCGSWE